MKSQNCVFCDILNKKIDADIVYVDDNFMAFLDIDPINEGHILLIPKKHVLDLDELEDALLFELIKATKKILTQLKKQYPLHGYTIMQNGGAFNDIGHLHVHLFPRYYGDDFGWVFK